MKPVPDDYIRTGMILLNPEKDFVFWYIIIVFTAVKILEIAIQSEGGLMLLHVGSFTVAEEDQAVSGVFQLLQDLLGAWEEACLSVCNAPYHFCSDDSAGVHKPAPGLIRKEGGPHFLRRISQPAFNLLVSEVLIRSQPALHQCSVRQTEGRNIDMGSIVKRSVIIKEQIHLGSSLTFDGTDQVDHFDRPFRTLAALVACFRAGTFNGLLDVFGGQNTEHDRNAAV